MSLRIFNVLGREKQVFKPINEGRVNMYVCGPTVYDYSHLGHAKTYVSFDVVVRYLRHLGYDVLYVQNLTDVGHLLETGEDRILRKAQQLQAKPMQIVEQYVRAYFEDMDALNVQRPDISPRASGHIPEQIEMIQTLLDTGHAYEVNGSVYFDVTSDEDYGKLSNRRIEEQEEGTRESVRSEKRNGGDFALWKKAEPEHILRWNSPWGEGFPGWHIECSAMSKKYLGETFDIHGGGIDNIYPHNENEIAQSECANEAPMANYWMLVGSLTVDSVKMSKSLGNFVRIKDALETYRPEVIRMHAISAHYSNPLDYSDKSIDDLSKAWGRLNDAVQLTRHQMNQASDSDEGNGFVERLEKARADFTEVMDDDFNTPGAIAIMQDLTRDVNTLLNGDVAVGLPVLKEIADTYKVLGGDILGILPDVTAEATTGGNAEREGKLIEMLIDMRARARVDKNYAESDRIRDELAGLGVVLEDRSDGTIWKVES
ncbi:cysteine--tRNA ligase [Phototrophicus methaneseepsis]|uniref:Cysteine--tRNA ligase n=1 Tax=Phototrophicus methaneseepsis TaxID=2710758 RepID=A0A7S8IG84_9CHLR|nr:cysteine--tRNA ligase [Phototrophicus methaneseepsis]QPC84402.1 cysteine--tRNA ligase [Phototrophicus methaneseepsis]